ncbi:hypothetical protein EQV77_09425 [Halobacillus fulvus]|nr:hypothetical protein EQV77_09425 [Halobacillus fulvus]
MRRGLAFPVTHEGERLFVLPDELIDAFQEADHAELRKTVKLNSEWPLLMNGMLHYYGYMSSKDIREALTSYTGETIDQHQFFTIIDQIPYHVKGFEYVRAKNGFKDIAADDPDKIEQEQKARPEIGFYRFSKAHLLEVGEDSVDFFSEKMEDFFKVVKRYYDVDRDLLEDLGFELETLIRNGTNMQELLNEMQERLEIPNEKVLKELMQALVEAHNDTRMYSLKGHKPNELKEQGMESNVVPIRRAQKVGRNEPCPCGSGKKYKKCCGK